MAPIENNASSQATPPSQQDGAKSLDGIPQATPDMCFHCFDVLIDRLQRRPEQQAGHPSKAGNSKTPAFAYQLPDASVECPIFVTWEKKRSASDEHSYQLRGCIGTLSPQLLVMSVGDYAIVSALKDRRFNPISIAEVALLRVSVSLLVRYEPCQNVFDWTVGTHGIMIKFHVNGNYFNATFLPEVAAEQRWDQQHTVEALIQKSGYNGAINETLLKSIQCTRYQSSKCKVTFQEYVLQSCQGKDPIVRTQSQPANQCVNL